jgi:polysaccharide biosynthesis transport protein
MELNAYLQLLRRWLWLIVLMAVVFGSTGFIIARIQPPRYQAATTIQVGGYSVLANPNTGQIQTAEQLAQTYVALAKTRPILELTLQNLKLDIPLETLSSMIQTRLVTGTSLMVITVTYTNPVVASDIANELAAQLIKNSPTNLTQDQQQQLTILQNEVVEIQKQIKAARDELSIIDSSIPEKTGQELLVLTNRRTELITEINTTQSNLAEISTAVSKIQQEGNSNSLRVVEPSSIPENPVGASVSTVAILSALVGSILAFGVGYVSEYLNNSIRSPEEILPLLNVPLLGAVLPFGKKRTYKDKLVTWLQPRSSMSEAYRAMRVNLIFKDGGTKRSGCKAFVVTSAGPGEGKSVTIANIAITFAQAGMRVLLIDADLRRPTAHLLFELPNTLGLSNLLQERNILKRPLSATDSSSFNEVLSRVVHRTMVPRLDVLTCGLIPSNPAELLGNEQMQYLADYLVHNEQYDVIFWDTPPVLVVSDSSVVAKLNNAQVIVVIQSGRTNRAAVTRAIHQLTTLSLPVAGVVLNRLDPRDVDTGYGQYYYEYSRYIDNTAKNRPLKTE